MRRITNVPIHVDAAGGLLPICADPGLIRQLVWNLVNNATRHAGKRQQSLYVYAMRKVAVRSSLFPMMVKGSLQKIKSICLKHFAPVLPGVRERVLA